MSKRTFFQKTNITRGEGIPKINFKLFGQWDEAMGLLKTLGPEVKKASIKAQLKVGNEIAQKIKGHLLHQDLGWKELSEKYAKKKSKGGLGSRTLIAYNTYYNNINVWQQSNDHLVLIGVKRGIFTRRLNGRRSKLDVATIAGIHEFSSGRRIPRRPLWNPTLMELGGEKGFKKMFINSLAWHLRRLGIQVKKEFFGSNVTINDQKISF